MLKKILYNKYVIKNIPENLPYTSEEFFKVLYDEKNVIMFKHGKELRLLPYSGYIQDFLGRATEFQPLAKVGTETYSKLKLKDVEKYEENVLRSCFSNYSFITDDVENYIELLTALDKAIMINSKQVFLPFIARPVGAQAGNALKAILKQILGKEYENMVVEAKITDQTNGTVIEPTNMQVFLQQIQDTKKKILEEAFLYLGVSAPAGKLAHQSELEVQQSSEIPDLLDKIILTKIIDFLARCNKHFDCKMTIKKQF